MADPSNLREVAPFLRVADMAASLRFYVGALGFSLDRRWVDGGSVRWGWLRRGSASLMLQDFRGDEGVWRPAGQLGEGVTLVFICEDALALYREAAAKGLQPTRPMVGNGMWLTILRDPDSYELWFESDTDVAEETAYVEGLH